MAKNIESQYVQLESSALLPGGFFLAPAEGCIKKALQAQRWFFRTDGLTEERTPGLRELDVFQIMSIVIVVTILHNICSVKIPQIWLNAYF